MDLGQFVHDKHLRMPRADIHPGYISKLHLHLNSLSINSRLFRLLLSQILTKQFHSDIIIQSSAVSSAACRVLIQARGRYHCPCLFKHPCPSQQTRRPRIISSSSSSIEILAAPTTTPAMASTHNLHPLASASSRAQNPYSSENALSVILASAEFSHPCQLMLHQQRKQKGGLANPK